MADDLSPPLETAHGYFTGLFRQAQVEPAVPAQFYGTRPGDGGTVTAIRFAAACVGSEAWAQLEAVWLAVDLARMTPAAMTGLLTGTFSPEAQAALPGHVAYAARCAAELRRRQLDANDA